MTTKVKTKKSAKKSTKKATEKKVALPSIQVKVSESNTTLIGLTEYKGKGSFKIAKLWQDDEGEWKFGKAQVSLNLETYTKLKAFIKKNDAKIVKLLTPPPKK